jgi:allophanate hydrolase
LPENLQIASLRAAYRQGWLTPAELVERVLQRVDQYPDPAVWISRVPTQAVRERAAALMAMDAADLPLYGIPFAVKDNMDVAGVPTTAACPAFAYTPERTATVVQRLLDAGAILIGKTNLDQFATGLVGTRSPYGAPRCVFDPRYVSGGSSSGSAVAVAAELVSFALGTDTAGSGRVPAAFNNLVGIKPSRGLLSTAGIVPACRSLDCVSVFAATVSDACAVVAVAQGPDPLDPYSREGGSASLPHRGLRVGVLAEADRCFDGDAGSAVLYDAAVERMRALGAEILTFDYAPFREASALLYAGPWVAERLAAIAPFYAAHAGALDPTVRGIIESGSAYSAADLFVAQYRLQALLRDTASAWDAFDVMLLPTAPTIPTVESVAADPVGRNSLLGTYTNFVNLLDLAAVAVPAGFRPDGLPFGVTLVAPRCTDAALAGWADRLHAASLVPGRVAIAVAGAHLSGMALNHELLTLGGTLRRQTRTAPGYRLYALAGVVPAKPGLVRDATASGPGIEVEVWELDEAGLGRFVSDIPAPLGIGKVALADGLELCGFICEASATQGATDITEYGGWRAYLASQAGSRSSAEATNITPPT